MKKVKLLMLILSAFFAFGIQSASAQYVDAQTAKTRILDKITQISTELETIKQTAGIQAYYDLDAKHSYYNAMLLGLKKSLTVEEILEQTVIPVANVASATGIADDATAYANTSTTKQAALALREEATQLLKI
jgi:hypothetical protein